MLSNPARWHRHKGHAQALVLFALTLSVLLSIALMINEVAYQRRTLARVRNSADMAALSGLSAIRPETLALNQPLLDEERALLLLQETMRRELDRVRSALTSSPAQVVERAEVTMLSTGESCQRRRPVTGPAICLRVAFGIKTLFGERQFTYETFAQATDQLNP